jgi:hypothetical protein
LGRGETKALGGELPQSHFVFHVPSITPPKANPGVLVAEGGNI